jgi:hypothetical protein
MRMTAEWFKAAKAHMDSPSLGRSVHHVKGHRVQSTLNSQVHRKRSTPKDWEFKVLTKMVNPNPNPCPKTSNCFKRMASLCGDIPCAWLTAIHTPRTKEGPISENKGCTPKIGKHKSTNVNAGTDKKRIRIEAKASMAYSELVSDNDSGTPYRLIQDEPTPAPTKPTFSTKDGDNASTLTQITNNLVALYIGHNPNLTSATMLVDYGASHILVRQEHIHVLKDVVMSAPNTKSFASLKSVKKGSKLLAIGRGLLQIGPFCLQASLYL